MRAETLFFTVKDGIVTHVNSEADGRSLVRYAEANTHDSRNFARLLEAAHADGSVGQISESVLKSAAYQAWYYSPRPKDEALNSRFTALAAAVRQYGTEAQEATMHLWSGALAGPFDFAVRTAEETGGEPLLLYAVLTRGRVAMVGYPLSSNTLETPLELLHRWTSGGLTPDKIGRAATALHSALQEMAVRPRWDNEEVVVQLARFEELLCDRRIPYRSLAPKQISGRNPRHVRATECG